MMSHILVSLIIFLFPFHFKFELICYLSIYTLITCFVHDLDALRVTWKIQVIGSLQYDKEFTISSWIRATIKGCNTLLPS